MIEKNYLKTKPECKVKFALPIEQIEGAKKVFLVGDFNNWDESATPMRKQKSGVFSSTINLEKDKQYQFRYLVDGTTWLNDESADAYAQSPISHDQNCVLQL
ncbi:MAG: glycoside hydrolase [Marinomonas sp.]|jgi:1,4-alpha-glucan branching enzyme|uniref:AMP-activated protein kinase-like protein n=1 Tax=Marinomonas communis TaxID=28254 RepID=A0A4R6X3M6_9GAMM|nr:isoamylase early set domain-containing protein [Marinomonas communis]MAF17243.1 glycoside hydrolase [Marinomonas sp.]MEC8081934.1 isoamylase early set domain-containing protein [Pseudomonadota bacterium]MAF17773.1 glycoside hydrolase [Marinomonas sp.]MCC4274193.1 isoamylase early set domain-containing protein [Marinomonas communis]MEC8482671.1 isoamylase early set domain-containing protein [Pseudomonadota bacterium]|tara:strand:+ start:34 stop:339 length:306 start_codon:yes stop_codon:yes gene_type:complete